MSDRVFTPAQIAPAPALAPPSVPAGPMAVSPVGRELIERNEGLRLDAYPDPATGGDPWTIGYGDTGPDVVPGLEITKGEADRRLRVRLDREFGAAVNRAIGDTPTTQGQFDAMVSLAYNIGVGGFDGSSVAREHAAGNYAAAADDFLKWNHAAGRVLGALTRRREEERALYLTDIPATAPGQQEPAPRADAGAVVEAIKALQAALKPYGYAGALDGDWGDGTEAAWQKYEANIG